MKTQIKNISIVEKLFNFNKKQKGERLKMITPKQMLERLPIALAQVKSDTTCENLLNEIIYSLYRSKEILKKVYSNTIN